MTGAVTRATGSARTFGRLSIVVVNYNYERYVGLAIESALAVRWSDLEVVVVDDGSTDGSGAVIDRYGDRITARFTENAGQRVAANRGYALTTGDVVVFLDSDDVLPPDLAVRLAAVWRPGVSKAQFQMQRIDCDGVASGVPFPAYRPIPSPAAIRAWMSCTSAYPTPPGSGNAYARSFLDRILPLGPEVGDAADSGPLAAAPFLGDVVSVPGVVVGYRRHGANDSNLLVDPSRFAREVRRAADRWAFAHRVSSPTEPVDERPLFRSPELLQLRAAAQRASPGGSPLVGDGRLRQTLDALRVPFAPGPDPLVRRLGVMAWTLAVVAAPRPMVRPLLGLRFGRS